MKEPYKVSLEVRTLYVTSIEAESEQEARDIALKASHLKNQSLDLVETHIDVVDVEMLPENERFYKV